MQSNVSTYSGTQMYARNVRVRIAARAYQHAWSYDGADWLWFIEFAAAVRADADREPWQAF
jgi:hypothetical protein